MKKIKYLLVVLLAVVFVTGCGSSNKTLKCTNKIEVEGINYSATYEIVYDSDEHVKEVTSTETIKSDDEDYLTEAKESSEQLYKSNDKTYGGYNYKISVSGDTLTSKCTIDYSKMDVKKYVEDTGLEDFADKDNNVKLSGVISIYEQLGATCEEKK